MTPEQIAEMQAQLAKLETENAKLKAKSEIGLGMKVSDKGALSVYGLGRFPVTLYAQQWEKLLAKGEDIKTFLSRNKDRLSVKAK